jgi:hypothetical protein
MLHRENKNWCCIQLSINVILNRMLEKLNESDVIQTEIQVKCYDLLSLVSINLDFKQTVKTGVFIRTAKKRMVTGNNKRKSDCNVRCELLKAVEDTNALFRVVMIEKINSNSYHLTCTLECFFRISTNIPSILTEN